MLSTAPAKSEEPSFRICEESASQPLPSEKNRAVEKYGSLIPELKEFLTSVGDSPTLQESELFFQQLSSLSLSRATQVIENPTAIMSIAYRFRLSLSVFQIDYCVHPSQLSVYDNFLTGLRGIDFPLMYRPKTLEGFLFLQEAGERGLDQSDAEFISRHLIDAPINRIVRDRTLALSEYTIVKKHRLARLCRALSSLGFEERFVSDFNQIEYSRPGCVELDFVGDARDISVSHLPSNFLVLGTNGGDLLVTTDLDRLPAFDLSSKLEQVVYAPLPSVAEFPVTIPLVAVVSPRNSDGSTRQYLGRYDGIVTLVHLFLARPLNGVRDSRVAPVAESGGNLSVLATNKDLTETDIAFSSYGQLGAKFLRSIGTPELVVEVERSTFDSFLFNSRYLGQIDGSFVPIASPRKTDLESLLFVDGSHGRSSLDVNVRVPLEWLQFLTLEQQEQLKTYCDEDLEQCVSSKLEEQLAQSTQLISMSCGGKCDMRELGIGLVSRQPAGIPAPFRLSAPNGADGDFRFIDEGD